MRSTPRRSPSRPVRGWFICASWIEATEQKTLIIASPPCLKVLARGTGTVDDLYRQTTSGAAAALLYIYGLPAGERRFGRMAMVQLGVRYMVPSEQDPNGASALPIQTIQTCAILLQRCTSAHISMHVPILTCMRSATFMDRILFTVFTHGNR